MKQVIKYVYDSKGRKYGCVVGLRHSDNTFPMIGLARCNLKEDNFSKKKAVALAKARAMKWGNVSVASNPVCSPTWNNNHLEDYLEKFTNLHEEEKFMKAIDFVIKQLEPKENNV